MFALWAGQAAGLSLLSVSSSQESFPAPPADHSLIYVGVEKGAVEPLAFEVGVTPLSADSVARGDKISYLEVKGDHAARNLLEDMPRFYLYVPDQPGVHPPFLVRFTPKRGARRVTAVAQRGQRGYAVASEEIVKPSYRVLSRDAGELFMEVRPREPLPPGEYGFVGGDLRRLATFRVDPARS